MRSAPRDNSPKAYAARNGQHQGLLPLAGGLLIQRACNSKGRAETPYEFGIKVSHTLLIRRGLGESAPYRATPKLAYLGRTLSEQRHRHWHCPAAAPRAAVHEERKLAHPAVTPEQQLHNNAQIDNELMKRRRRYARCKLPPIRTRLALDHGQINLRCDIASTCPH